MKEDTGIDAVIAGLPNVKREKRLPVVLAKKEILDMINATNNYKHRMMIQIGYAAMLGSVLSDPDNPILLDHWS